MLVLGFPELDVEYMLYVSSSTPETVMLDASGNTHSVSVYTTVNVVTLVALENRQALSCWRPGPRNLAKGLGSKLEVGRCC